MRVLILLFLPLCISAQEIAFPQAEGFGKFATGGRGGKIIMVTNLQDDGPGSLREALAQKYPRMIVFGVAGTIKLKSVLDIKYGDVSILGHSAPGEGITVRDYPIKATGIQNVIIRYIRSRLGDESKYEGDAISITGCQNIIVDHCSFSWSSDESATFYDNRESTVQYCIISESLNRSVHSKGEHGYGGIWGGMKASFHHNLLANHKSRNPRFNGARYHKQPSEEIVDFTNNVIYNWRTNSSYGGEEGNYNIVNNYYKTGVATKSKEDKILDPYKPYGRFFLSGNLLVGNEDVTNNNWKGVTHKESHAEIRLEAVIPVESISIDSPTQAFEKILASAGASFCRDVVDERIIREVRSGVPTFSDGIVNSQADVGGWPQLKIGKLPRDDDKDGLPNKWEIKMGLNPTVSSDASERTLDRSYSNIEVYLNAKLTDLNTK